MYGTSRGNIMAPDSDVDDLLRDLGLGEARHWDKVSRNTNIFHVPNGSLIYIKRSDEENRNAWWGLRKNLIERLANEGVVWRALLVNPARKVGYVIEGEKILEMVKSKNVVGQADYQFWEDSPELRRLPKMSFEQIRRSSWNQSFQKRAGTPWERKDVILVLQLYKATGPSHDARDPAVREIARILQRSPDSIAQKIANFRAIETEGKRGLVNFTVLDQKIWKEFDGRENELNQEAEKIRSEIYSKSHEVEEEQVKEDEEQILDGQWAPSERFSQVRVRQQTQAFRQIVLKNYDGKCAFCDMDLPQLLEVSHIRGWHEDAANRLNPSNALSLCLLHHGAFDDGLLTIKQDNTISASPTLKKSQSAITQSMLTQIDGKQMRKANRFPPNSDFLSYHRDNVFRKENA